MNFISQYLSNLTSGGITYIAFQIIYLVCGCAFMVVQIKIYKVLKEINKWSGNGQSRNKDNSNNQNP